MRAPKAEKDPAPPGMSRTGGRGGGKCISSVFVPRQQHFCISSMLCRVREWIVYLL
jgi:hypothetical protein